MQQQYFWWVVICADVLLIGITKSGFGSGVGLMVVPVMTIALGHVPGRGSEAALGLLLPLLIVGDLVAVGQYLRLLSQPHAAAQSARRMLWRLMPGTAVGIVLGGALLWALHRQSNLVGALIRIEIGIESVLLVGLHWWRQWRGVQTHLMPEPWRSQLTGGFSAVSSTLAHAAGPIIAMYLLPLNLERQLYVGTCAVYFFVLNTAKLPAYYISGQFAHAEFSFTIRFLPLVLAGAFLGKWVVKRMNDRLFSKIVYFVTFGLGWYILIEGIMELLGKTSA